MSTILRTTKFIRRLSISDWKSNSVFYHLKNRVLQNNRVHYTSLVLARNVIKNNDYEYNKKNNYEIDKSFSEARLKIKLQGHINIIDVELLLKDIKHTDTVTKLQALYLLQFCTFFQFIGSPKMRVAIIDKIWTTLKILDTELEICHYNALMYAYIRNEIEFDPINILNELEKKNIKADCKTYELLIKQYCKKGNTDYVTKILEIMNKENISINENIFDSLIKGYAISGKESNALNVINIMKKSGVMPTSSSYTEIACMYAKNGDINTVIDILDEYKTKNVIFGNKDILQIIYTLAINKHSQHIKEILPYIRTKFSCDNILIEYMNILIENNLLHEALILFNLLENQTKCSKYFIKKLVSCDVELKTIIEYCKTLSKFNSFDSLIIYALYNAYIHNLHHLGIPLINVLHESGVEIRQQYFFPLLVSNKNNLEGMVKIIEEMIWKYKFAINVRTLNNYVHSNCTEDLKEQMKHLKKAGINEKHCFNSIVYHLFQQHKVKEAINFIVEHNRNKIPHVTLNEAVIPVLCETKDVTSIIKLLTLYKDSLDYINTLVLNIIYQLNSDETTVNTLLKKMIQNKIEIDEKTVIKIREHVGDNYNINDLPINKSSDEKSYVKTIIVNTGPKVNTGSNNIQYLINMNNISGLKKELQKVERRNESLPLFIYDRLINYFSCLGDIRASQKWFKELKIKNPYYKMEFKSLINYTNLQIKEKNNTNLITLFDRPMTITVHEQSFIDYEGFFSNLAKNHPNQVTGILSRCWNVMNQTDNLKEAILIKLYSTFINENNSKAIIETFEWIHSKYNLTNCYKMLLKHFINTENIDYLQRIMNVCVNYYGKFNSLFRLGVCYLELDKFEQVEKIFVINNVMTKERIHWLIEQFTQHSKPGNHDRLLKLFEILTKNNLILEEHYIKLMSIYERDHNLLELKKLYNHVEMMKPNLSLSFITTINKTIKQAEQLKCDPQATINDERENKLVFDTLAEINKNLEYTNIDNAIKILSNTFKNNALKPENIFTLIQNLIHKLFDSDDFLNIRNLFYVLSKNMSHDLRERCTIELNKLCFHTNKYNDLLIACENGLTDDKDQMTKNRTLLNLIHCEYTIEILSTNSEIEEQFKHFARNVFDKKLSYPMNIYWLFKLLKNDCDSEEIWNLHLKDERVLWPQVIGVLKKNNALNKFPFVSKKIVEHTYTDKNIKKCMFQNIFKVLLDSDNSNKYELIYDCLTSALKIMESNEIHDDLLNLLKSNLNDQTKIESLQESVIRQIKMTTN